MKFDEYEIEEKIDQLRNKYLADIDYLTEAVVSSLREVVALRNASSIDDTLYAADMLRDAIALNVMPIERLRTEALEELAEEYYNDNPAERGSYAKDLCEAGHKESDFA
jgi:hypothetical protein